MASLLALAATGVGVLTSALVGGFGFAGGALAFQKIEKSIEDKIKEGKKVPDKDNINSGKRKLRDDKSPFSETRFLNHVDKKFNVKKFISELKK